MKRGLYVLLGTAFVVLAFSSQKSYLAVSTDTFDRQEETTSSQDQQTTAATTTSGSIKNVLHFGDSIESVTKSEQQTQTSTTNIEDSKQATVRAAAANTLSYTIVVHEETYRVNMTPVTTNSLIYSAEVIAPEKAKTLIDLDLKDPDKKAQANTYLEDAFTALVEATRQAGGQFDLAQVQSIKVSNIAVADFSAYDRSPIVTTLANKSAYFRNMARLTFPDMVAGDGVLKSLTASVPIANLILPKIKRIGDSFAVVAGEITPPLANVNAKLIGIYAPEVEEIGDYAFHGQSLLRGTLTSPDASGTTSTTLLSFPKVTKIGKQAFRNAKVLKYLALDNLVEMGEGAFEECADLTGGNAYGFSLNSSGDPLLLPKLKAIPARAFYNCTKLMQISASEAKSIGDEAFYNCSSLGRLLVKKVEVIGHSILSMKSGTSAGSALTSIALPVIKKIETDSFSGNSAFKGILTSLRNLYSSDTDAVRDNLPREMLLYAFPDYEKYSDRFLNVGETYDYQFYRDEDMASEDTKTLYKYIVLKQPTTNSAYYQMHKTYTPSWGLQWNIFSQPETFMKKKVSITIGDPSAPSTILMPGFYQGVADLNWTIPSSASVSGTTDIVAFNMVLFTGEEKPVNQVMLDIHDIYAKQGDTAVDFVTDIAASEEQINLEDAQLTIAYPSDKLTLGDLWIEQNGQDITGNARVELSTSGTVLVTGINAQDIKNFPVKIHFKNSKAEQAMESESFEGSILSASLYDTDKFTVEIIKEEKAGLSLLWVPDIFDFGSHRLAELKEETFQTTTELPAYLVVSDMRGTEETNGWKVQLTASHLTENKSGDRIENVEYLFTGNKLKEYHTDDVSLPPNQTTIIEPSDRLKENSLVSSNFTSAETDTGILSAKTGGISGYYALEINDIQLKIQELTKINGSAYNGTLTWTLEDTL
ncbi:leucine-rich repeat protein [Enterococcus wangshanyuanii]|uniref:WxL domain-containing protein n=1 Tax=Enterococcus wangshanyuanii TaxID=2005703 RepID=A0ABQ1PDY8_9ENTE|nr:leucine-rich repeat protein [Enterococcus wangshanyuanii]GGC95329.1 hypothetical protein GCM10011573_26260 [Enterococcus wangshanyuanii]